MTTYTLTHGQVTWVNIVGTTEEDLAGLARLYPQFHPLNLRDCLAQLEYPKVDHHDDYLFLIMHFPVFEKRQRLSVANEVDMFIAGGLLVTAHQGQLKPLVELFDACTQDPAAREQYMGHGASPLMHVLIDRLVNYCFPIVTKVDSQILHIEENLFADRPRHILEEIAVVRRDLIALRRILRPQYDVLCALEEGKWPWIQEELDIYWRDIRDRLRQLRAMLDEDAEVLDGLSSTIDTLASHRIDEVVRVLTVATIVTLPLMLLFTLYSMNVHIPYEEHPATFFTVLVLGLLVTGVVLWLLRRRDWL